MMENIAQQLEVMLEEATLDVSLRARFANVLSEFTQANTLLISILNHWQELITAYDSNKRLLYCNKACEKNMGIQLKDAIGTPLTDLFSDYNLAHFTDKVLRGEDVFVERGKFKNREGFFEAQMTPMRDKKGEIIGGINYVRDITDKVIADEKIRKNEKLLAETQQLAKIGAWEWSLTTDKLYWSDEMYRIFGLEPGSIEITPEMYLSFIASFDAANAAKEFHNSPVITDKGNITFDRLINKSDGKKAYIAGSASYIFDDEGKPVRLAGFVQDVTEIKLTEQNLLTMNAELERSNNELEQFAYIASHDLKEPLRMITSYAQLLVRQQSKQDESAALYSKFITDGVKNINELIDSLLQYSRVGKKDKEFKAINCHAILDEIKSGLQIKIDETDSQIIYNSLPQITGVPVLIKQLFQNLIENSIKFRAEKTPVITITADEDENEWQFYVQDNGIGIDPAHFERIFKIFQRLHSREQFPGSGIGLAVCKKIAEIHKGIIWVESEPGKGSVFSFTIAKPTRTDIYI